MYLLLNLREPSRLEEVVQLLFRHGHTALSIGSSVEDLCPTCDRASKLNGEEKDTSTSSSSAGRKRPHSQSSPVSDPVMNYSTPSSYMSTLPSTSAQVTPPPIVHGDAPTSMSSTSMMGPTSNYGNFSKQMTTSPSLPGPSYSLQDGIDIEDHRQQPHSIPRYQRDDVKVEHLISNHPPKEEDEPLDIDVVEDGDMNRHGDFGFDSAMKLLATNDHNQERLSPCSDGEAGPSSSKRNRRHMEENDAFQCQLCKKCITRAGQHANLMNHLSRHARLHASKKQYSCPICNLGYSRRYLAMAHIRDVHSMEQEPHDFGDELREEYHALLQVCFPGAALSKKRYDDTLFVD